MLRSKEGNKQHPNQSRKALAVVENENKRKLIQKYESPIKINKMSDIGIMKDNL